MSSDEFDSKKPQKLIVSPSTGLVKIPSAGSSALTEIIDRSLVHIMAGKALALPERLAGEECEFEIAPGVKIVMCWIPPGEFLMGSPEDERNRYDEETQHLVKITQGYWLAKTQTTQAQWQAVTGDNPSKFKGGDLPVERVSWLNIRGYKLGGGFVGSVNKFQRQIVGFTCQLRHNGSMPVAQEHSRPTPGIWMKWAGMVRTAPARPIRLV
jgi:hypothetical protein